MPRQVQWVALDLVVNVEKVGTNSYGACVQLASVNFIRAFYVYFFCAIASCADCHASLPKLLPWGPKSPAMNHIFNVLGFGLILDTRSSHPMENPSALRLYRHAKIDPMICKLAGSGDDHGGILTHLLSYRMYVFHCIEAYGVMYVCVLYVYVCLCMCIVCMCSMCMYVYMYV